MEDLRLWVMPTHQIRGLRVFLRRLLQPSMCCSNPTIALVHKSKYVRFVLHLETIEDGVARVGLLCSDVLRFQALCV